MTASALTGSSMSVRPRPFSQSDERKRTYLLKMVGSWVRIVCGGATLSEGYLVSMPDGRYGVSSAPGGTGHHCFGLDAAISVATLTVEVRPDTFHPAT